MSKLTFKQRWDWLFDSFALSGGERQIVMKYKNSCQYCFDSEKNILLKIISFKLAIVYCLSEMRGNSYIKSKLPIKAGSINS